VKQNLPASDSRCSTGGGPGGGGGCAATMCEFAGQIIRADLDCCTENRQCDGAGPNMVVRTYRCRQLSSGGFTLDQASCGQFRNQCY
jgi:hypothetical protein